MNDGQLRELQRRAHERDESARRKLFRLFRPKIHGFASKRLYDPGKADDIVQETMLVVFTCPPEEFAQRSSVSAFVYGIAAKKILDQNRRDKRRRMAGLADVVEHVDPGPECEAKRRARITWATRLAEPFPEDLAICQNPSLGLVRDAVIAAHIRRDSFGELEEKMCQAVCRLSHRRHQCIVLQHWGDLSVIEIGETLGIAVASVKTNLQQAREQLRDDLI